MTASRPTPIKNITLLEDLSLGYHLIEVTPQVAALWVEKYNVSNRKLAENKVFGIQTEMAQGGWHDRHPHGFCFLYDEEGRLYMADGQHRAVALSRGTLSVLVWVYIDAPESKAVRAAIDKGRHRTTGDNLGRDPHSTAVFKRVLFGLGAAPVGWTDANYREMDEKFGWAVDFVVERQPKVRSAPGLTDSRVLGTIALGLLYGVPEERTHEFLSILKTGQLKNPEEDAIVLALRNYLLIDVGRQLGEVGGTKHAVHEDAWKKTQDALEAFVLKKHRSRLSASGAVAFASINPTIVPGEGGRATVVAHTQGLVIKTLSYKPTLIA